jgi:hypothetical protein
MSDAQVAATAMAERAAKTGSEFLPLFLQKIVAISCVIRRTTKEGTPQIKVGTLGTPQDDEKILVQAFFDLIEKYTPQLVSWNGSGFDLPVLHYRALVNNIQAPRYCGNLEVSHPLLSSLRLFCRKRLMSRDVFTLKLHIEALMTQSRRFQIRARNLVII